MNDRIPLYPGRVKMTPVAGQANTFDMVRADDPTQAGTPLNKATFLKDATAALYGLGTGAVPDDVLAELGKYKQYWWKRRTYTDSGEYIGQLVEGPNDSNRYHISYQNDSQLIRTIQYADSYTVNGATGEITLNSPSSITSNSSGDFPSPGVDALYGKYCKNLYAAPNDVIFIDEKATITRVKNSSGDVGYYIDYPTNYVKKVEAIYKPDIHIGPWGYVQSSERNTYPDSGILSGYEYEYLGIPFDNAVTAPKIETGSYVGTGTYGASNPNTLTFGFAPYLVIMYYADGRYSGNLRPYDDLPVAVVPMDFITTSYSHTNSPAVTGYSADYTYSKKSDDGKTLFWYNTRNAMGQLNNTNDNVFYMAIG